MRVPILSHPRTLGEIMDSQQRPIPCTYEFYTALLALQLVCEKMGVDIPITMSVGAKFCHVPISMIDFLQSYHALLQMNA